MAKILLVDDDDSLRIVIARTLQSFGHEIRSVENGRKALAVHREWSPDLVITDLIMPEKEGLETIQAMRGTDKTVKIIAMSGGGRVSPGDYLDIALHLGANAVLPKPFDIEQLRDAIRPFVDDKPQLVGSP